jgi:adiponectin receptor
LIPSSSALLGLAALLVLLWLGFFLEDELASAEAAASHTIHRYIQFYPSTDLTDAIAAGIFLLGVATCLGLSATFHTLKSHSHAVATLGNQLDYLGIVILIVASMVTLTHYSFIDQTILFRSTFWSITGALGTICAIVSVKPTFRSPDWRSFRASMFVAFGLSGVIPLLASLYFFGSISTWARMSQGWLLAEAGLYISGAALYALRVPECFAPGKYDYFGHSHQIFHVLVVLAAICHGKCLYESYKYGHAVLLAEAL